MGRVVFHDFKSAVERERADSRLVVVGLWLK